MSTMLLRWWLAAFILAPCVSGECNVGRLVVVRAEIVEEAKSIAAEIKARVLTVSQVGDADFTRIQDAVDVARAGDLILVRAGEYAERVTITADGEPDRPMVLMAEEDGVVIDGGGERVCIDIRGDYIRVDGFECRNAGLQPRHPNDGTIVLCGGRGVVVENCICSGAVDGYKVADISATGATEFLIRNNRCLSEISHSIDIGWKSTDGIVEHNELSGSYSAIYVHAMAHRTTVRYNVARDFMMGGSEGRDPWHGSGVVCRDNVGANIHHNLFVGPQASGVLLYDFQYDEHGPNMPGNNELDEGHVVHHNTAVGPSLFGIELSGDVQACSVSDNLVVGATRGAFRFYNVPADNVSNRLQANAFWDCAEAVLADSNVVVDRSQLLEKDPQFVTPERGGYRPGHTSSLTRFGAYAPSSESHEEPGRPKGQ